MTINSINLSIVSIVFIIFETIAWSHNRTLLLFIHCFHSHAGYENVPMMTLWATISDEQWSLDIYQHWYQYSSLIISGYMVWKVICAIEVAYCVALATYTVLYFSEETKSKPHGNNPLHYEETRELLGIVLVMVWMTVCLFYSPERWDHAYSNQSTER